MFDNLSVIAEGGEAVIYKQSYNSVLKCFKPTVDLSVKKEKVDKLIKANLPKNIIVPESAVFHNGVFVGYIMKKVLNSETLHELTKNKFIRINQINNKDVLNVCIEIDSTLETIHKVGIIAGDINDYNILFNINNIKKQYSFNSFTEKIQQIFTGQTNKIYFVDSDSWGIGSLKPDSFSEMFTAPEAYSIWNNINLTRETDLFSSSVLIFNLLARIHPFGGSFKKDPSLSTVERIKKGLSVLGKEKIIIPKMVPSWEWMSPDLKKLFLSIFEKGERTNIASLLEENIINSKYCLIHNLYYYSGYKECPLCSGKAILKPTATKPVVLNLILKTIFKTSDLSILLDKYSYLNTENEIVHIKSGRKIPFETGKIFAFSDDGNFVFIGDEETIKIINIKGENSGIIEKKFKTKFQVIQDNLYYIDNDNFLSKVAVADKKNMKTIIHQVFNPFFFVDEKSENVFSVSLYNQKAIVCAHNRNYQINYSGKIKEYGIKFDPLSKNWLFIYQLAQGNNFRILIFSEKQIEYDNCDTCYQTESLSGLCFYNNTVYYPDNNRIVGRNYIKRKEKAFPCSVVNENSYLEFENGKFTIVTEEKIYDLGF